MAYDLFVLVCAVLGVLVGYKRGFALHTAGLVALVLGFVVGIPLTKLVLGAQSEPSPATSLIIFLVCCGAGSFAVHLIGVAVRSKLKKRSLESWDRQLGAVLGVVHGRFLCLMLTFAAVVIAPSLLPPILERPSGKAMQEAFRAIHAVLPADVQEGMQPLIERSGRDE